MKKMKKTKNREEGAGYWISFSDLMSGVLIVFILLFIYKLFDYQESMAQKEQMIQELSSTRLQIISMLKEEFEKENIDIAIDPKTGAIRLSESILFDFGKSELKGEGKAFLEKFIPIYLSILLEEEDIRSHISQIIIEGHTDDNSTYIYNLKLSQERAFSVVEFLLSDGFEYSKKEDLQQYLTANGRSYSEIVQNDDGTINEEASRRVEIKFRLNEEETLLKIQEELQKGIE
ncbi:OmpA/MotB family protein [Clostridium butyricum]|uniref:OmpA/MotB family protein n=1 Tax=Clostridium butyricum TaxID=1492 RepID=UPI0021023D43|nr:OmpA family protein [Clostridium butyricum]MCQ2012912.1 OmpA family protein [Clostridium butyricum]MCQ2026609.1 OmpA family protein [Clostridium butyricum]